MTTKTGENASQTTAVKPAVKPSVAVEKDALKMTAKIIGKNLVITIPCDPKAAAVSATGKTRRVASSEGNKPTELEVDGQSVIIGLNAYIYANPR